MRGPAVGQYSPWAFKDREQEAEFLRDYVANLVDRNRWVLISSMGWVGAIWAISIPVALASVRTWTVQESLIAIARLAIYLTGVPLITVNWSARVKPILGLLLLTGARLSVLFAIVFHAGVEQHDAPSMLPLIVALYLTGAFTQTYMEYLCGAVIATYTKPASLYLFGGPCPFDSSRRCTTRELSNLLLQHSLMLGIGVAMYYFVFCDRRRAWLRSRRPSRSTGSSDMSDPASKSSTASVADKAATKTTSGLDGQGTRRKP